MLLVDLVFVSPVSCSIGVCCCLFTPVNDLCGLWICSSCWLGLVLLLVALVILYLWFVPLKFTLPKKEEERLRCQLYDCLFALEVDLNLFFMLTLKSSAAVRVPQILPIWVFL